MYLMQRVQNSYKLKLMKLCLRGSFQAITMPFRRLNRRLKLPSELAKRKDLNIHFGCGEINDPRFINIDARPFPHVHLIDSSPMLRTFRDNRVDSIYACHVLEHFSRTLKPDILRRWFQILKPGGRLLLSVPDFDKLVKIFQYEWNVESIEAELMGGQDYTGNFHYSIFNRRHLTDLLARAGFIHIAEWNPSTELRWPRDHSWDNRISLNLSGRKPFDEPIMK